MGPGQVFNEFKEAQLARSVGPLNVFAMFSMTLKRQNWRLWNFLYSMDVFIDLKITP